MTEKLKTNSNNNNLPSAAPFRKYRKKTLVDLRRWVAHLADQVERGSMSESMGRTLTYMGNAIATFIEKGDLEERIAELERKEKEHESTKTNSLTGKAA